MSLTFSAALRVCFCASDGDVIESFMDLPVDKQELIAQQLGLKHSECVKRVEDVMRIH